MIVSMNELLKDTNSGAYMLNPEGIIILIYNKGGIEYLSFIIGSEVILKAEMKTNNYYDFIWDKESKTGALVIAALSTGRLLRKVSRTSRKYKIRFPFVHNVGLPYPLKRTEALNIECKKGLIKFIYDGEIDEIK